MLYDYWWERGYLGQKVGQFSLWFNFLKTSGVAPVNFLKAQQNGDLDDQTLSGTAYTDKFETVQNSPLLIFSPSLSWVIALRPIPPGRRSMDPSIFEMGFCSGPLTRGYLCSTRFGVLNYPQIEKPSNQLIPKGSNVNSHR
jgi:hypothetical protein